MVRHRAFSFLNDDFLISPLSVDTINCAGRPADNDGIDMIRRR